MQNKMRLYSGYISNLNFSYLALLVQRLSVPASTRVRSYTSILGPSPSDAFETGITTYDVARSLASELLARLHSVGVQDVLECKQESGGDDALGDLGSNTCYCQQPAT